MTYAVGMKLKRTEESSNGERVAKIYWCAETSEYVVRFFENFEYLGEGPSYYTEDLGDAIDTSRNFTATKY